MKEPKPRWNTRKLPLFLVTMALAVAYACHAANSAVVPVARTNASWIQRHELIFVQPDGTIPRSLMYDFEHPTPMGHRVWAEAIEPKVAELMGDKPIAPMP